MTDQSLQVLRDALRLSTGERAELAAELLASLDDQVDPDAEAAWAVELERRARRVLAGGGTTYEWSAVYADLRRELESR